MSKFFRKREIKDFTLKQIINHFDGKSRYVIRDREDKLVFMGANFQNVMGFAERLKDSGHTVTIDDTVHMTAEQLFELEDNAEPDAT